MSGAQRPIPPGWTSPTRAAGRSIDGEFVSGCLDDHTDQLIIASIVQIARGLGRQTIAEFVSDPQLERFVRTQGVELAQGFHVGRPVAVGELGLHWPIAGVAAS